MAAPSTNAISLSAEVYIWKAAEWQHPCSPQQHSGLLGSGEQAGEQLGVRTVCKPRLKNDEELGRETCGKGSLGRVAKGGKGAPGMRCALL